MKYSVIKIGAEWCGPCRIMDQKLKDFKKCEIKKYNVDDADEDFLAKYKIRNIPATIIIDENGDEIFRYTGIFNVNDLENKLTELENG